MKVLKYLIPVLVLLAIAVVIANMRRDSIALEIANSLLGDTAARITDVKMERLASTRVVFARVDAELAGGSALRVEGLEIPLDFPSVRPEYVAVEVLEVLPAPGGGEPEPLSPLLGDVLALPGRIPSTALTVAELHVGDRFTATDLVWTTAADLQRLAFVSAGVRYAFESGVADRGYYVSGTAAPEGSADALSLDAEVDLQDPAAAIEGDIRIRLGPWRAVLDVWQTLPEGLDGIDGELTARASIRLDGVVPGGVYISAAVETPADFVLTADSGLRVSGRLPSGAAADIEAEWPAGSWTLAVPEARWQHNVEGIEAPGLRTTDLSCTDAVRCTLTATAGPGRLVFGDLSAGSVYASLPLSLTPGAETRAEIGDGARISVDDLRLGGVAADTLVLEDIVGAEFALGDDLRGRLESAVLDLGGLASGNATLDRTALGLSDVRIDMPSAGPLNARSGVTMEGGAITVEPYTVQMPRLEGATEVAGDRVRLDFSAARSDRSLELSGTLHHDFTAAAGDLSVDSLRLDFATASLSSQVDGLPADADIVAGEVAANATVAWGSDGGGAPRIPSAEFVLDDLAATYRDIALTGLAGTVEASYGAAGASLRAERLTAGLLDIGLPIEDLEAGFAVAEDGVFDVDSLAFSLLGGRVTAAPFEYDLAQPDTRLVLSIDGIQLRLIAELAGFESVQAEGNMTGRIPINLVDGGLTVSAGRLENVEPGGVIRFDAEAASAVAAQGAIGIATKALANFRFDTLVSDVTYTADGDLLLDMRVEGINPDMDPEQPIILNLGIENNVPQMLRSLQAVRSIQDVIEERTNR